MADDQKDKESKEESEDKKSYTEGDHVCGPNCELHNK